MSSQGSPRVLLGHISAAHGIRGEVVLKSYTAVPDDIASYGRLHDEAGSRTFVIQSVRQGKHGLIARIEGVVDRSSAEELSGTRLFVAREALPALKDEGEFYVSDLIGLVVRDRAGSDLGVIVALQNYGAGDLIEIRSRNADRTELLPFDEKFVPVVDVVQGYVILDLPEVGSEPGDPD